MAGEVPYSKQLLDKVQAAFASTASEQLPDHASEDLARELLKRDVWLIERTRRAHLVDDLVYESALNRGHAWRQLAQRLGSGSRMPPAKIWRSLLPPQEAS